MRIHLADRGLCPCDPGIYRFPARMAKRTRGGSTAPVIPATESALEFHPWSALSSAQLCPQWTNNNLAANAFPANGDSLLNFVSQPRGPLHRSPRNVYPPPDEQPWINLPVLLALSAVSVLAFEPPLCR